MCGAQGVNMQPCTAFGAEEERGPGRRQPRVVQGEPSAARGRGGCKVRCWVLLFYEEKVMRIHQFHQFLREALALINV